MKSFRKYIWQADRQVAPPYPTKDDLRRMVNQVRDWGFEVLITAAKYGAEDVGVANYHSKLNRIHPVSRDFDRLMVVAEEANRIGLEIHACSCVFVDSLVGETELMRAHPEARAIGWTEEGLKPRSWACPSHQSVRDYNVAICKEILKNYPVRGVNLDFIRNGGFSIPYGCECEICRAKLRELTGKPAETAGPGWDFSQQEEIYLHLTRWRAGHVTEVVRRVHDLAQARGQMVTVDVFSNFPVCYFDNGQDWVNWAHQGIIDCLFPMTYIPLPEVFKWYVESYVAMVKGKVPIVPGMMSLQNPHFNLRPDIHLEQARLAKEAGAAGIAVFEYTPGVTDKLAAALKYV